jgi:hypothetical protein
MLQMASDMLGVWVAEGLQDCHLICDKCSVTCEIERRHAGLNAQKAMSTTLPQLSSTLQPVANSDHHKQADTCNTDRGVRIRHACRRVLSPCHSWRLLLHKAHAAHTVGNPQLKPVTAE